MTSPSAVSASTIPSTQELSSGVPRFQVPAVEHPLWETAAQIEAAGGVDAEVRAFLDAQLETGDLVLDLDPGFGFVTLSATTAPNGMPTVFVASQTEERLTQLQDAAAEAGGWVEPIELDDPELLATIDARLERDARIFVHLAADQIAAVTERLHDLIAHGRVLALCISDASSAHDWEAAREALQRAGFAPCTLFGTDDRLLIAPISGTPVSAVIALPSSLVADTAAAPDAEQAAEPVLDIFPVADDSHASPANRASLQIMTAPSSIVANGFAFQSSHSRTGYGVAGAQLLHALQRQRIPVAYFPIGPVDPSLTDNPTLRTALEAQGSYRTDVPSVRLSQQFDLAQHIGRGPRVGFTIFELDTFTARELHHLRSQDALMVCSDWARQVCLDNGVTSLPIHVVPLGVDRAVFHEQVTPARTFKETTFLQVGKLEPRKGQLELLRAFEAAFTPKDNVRLVLVCGNPFVTREQMQALLKPFRKSPMAAKITLLTEELPSQREVAAWMAAADCGVFVARAEGWNLEALEMLAMGREVIATDYSAHRQFLDPENAKLIRIDALEPAAGGAAIGRWAAWGTAQHEQLVMQLRAVHAQRQSDGRQRNVAGLATATQFSWDASASAMVRALESLG